MKQYKNNSASPVEIVYESDSTTKHHIVNHGQLFSFDETADNGPEIEQQCINFNMEQV